MKSWEREIETHFDLIGRFVDLAGLEKAESELIKKELARYMRVRLDRGHWIPSNITTFHTEWYREFYRTLGVDDPYRAIKARSNRLAQRILRALSIADLRQAVVASIIANKLDFGVLKYYEKESPLTPQDFSDLNRQPLFFDDFEALAERVGKASVVLYLTDNHGEVLFDRIVIEQIQELNPESRIYAAGKASPMLNDVTFDELEKLGFGQLCSVISTGSNCFGVPPDEVSDEFKQVLAQSDLVIAKGQAYLEFWIDYRADHVFNLAHTKFPIKDAALGTIPAGENLLISSLRYKPGKPPFPSRSGN